MKVGLLNSPTARLNAYWSAYLKELGVQVAVTNLSAQEALKVGAQSLPTESVTVQLALGRILALGRVDAVLVPELPAVSGDAWGQAFTELLPRRISGLPALIAVPDGGDDLEAVATEIGLRLSHNAGKVRLALEKVRKLALAPKVEMPLLSRSSRATVAVIGPRALLGEDALAGGLKPALESLGLHPVFSHHLPLTDVLKRAERMERAEKTPAGERELFGASSLLAGKSAVKGFIFAAPARDAATTNALKRLAEKLHKPVLPLSIEAGQTEFPQLEGFRDQITLGSTTPEQEENA